jgi:type II secretory pathway pseudopilin PulG
MKTLLRLLLKSQHQRNRSEPAQTDKGMTLVELLVGAIMAFLIITPMLAFVVDMLNTDRREQVKSNTEQDLQAAVDFIAQDLSQAIYIYDGKGINQIKAQLPPNDGTSKTPILVFWKRQQIKNSLPIDKNIEPKDCSSKPDKCNDTYVLSLVAYYQFTDKEPTWCQPSGDPCPSRIARYEISERLRNPYTPDVKNPYYEDGDLIESQKGSKAFNKDFDFSKPTVNVTTGSNLSSLIPQVLVNYIHHSSTNVPIPTGAQCKDLLSVTPPPAPATFDANDLLITNSLTHSFYACVDTSKNIASVTLRGNSLRRLQADAPYNNKNPAYFPTATVQVQGLGGLGK